MDLKVFCKKVFDRLYNYLWFNNRLSSIYHCYEIKKQVGNKNIWFLGLPKSTNLGDQAQVYCIEKWFKKNYPDYKVHEYDSYQLLNHNCMILDCIAASIKTDDIVFFESGYNFTDMYPNQEKMHRETVKRIKSKKIIFLPQTISFQEPYDTNSFIRESADLYCNNNNISLLCRDYKSFEIAKETLPSLRKKAYPDFVTSLIGRIHFKDTDRSGVVLCVRHDREGIYNEDDFKVISDGLKEYGNITINDTTLDYPSQFFIRRNRKKYIMKMLHEFHSSRVIVTDRYHGLVFSLVSNTPVVLLKTIDHKITEGVKWFPESYRKHIRIADSPKDAIRLAKEFINEPTFMLDDYFYKEYFSKLKSVIYSDNEWDY